MILGQNRNSAFRVVEGHVVDLQEVAVGLAVQLALPKVHPLIDRIAWFFGVEGLLSYADQLESRNVEHLLQRTRIVPSLDYLKRDTVADLEHRRTHLRRQSLVFLRWLVPFLQFLSRLAKLILQLDIFLKGPQRIRIVFLILTLHLLALNPSRRTRLIGFSSILIFFCSLSSSLPFIPSTSIALFMLFLSQAGSYLFSRIWKASGNFL